MGTRSLTYVFSERGDGSVKPILCMYRQFDGYPEGHGQELAAFLLPFEMVNGIPVGKEVAIGKVANGMGCLAAQLVKHFKIGVGGFYLQPGEPGQDCGQEYEYHVHEDSVVVFTSYNDSKQMFKGTWQEFSDWCNKPESDESEVETVKTDLPTALKTSTVTVTFTKADGSKRVMNCTTCVDIIPVQYIPVVTKTKINSDPDLFKVFDVDISAWRSFRKERVIDWVML
jgi:hypothetical protein